MTQDERHLDLLSTFHYVLGGLSAVFACFPLMHVLFGLAMLAGLFNGDDMPPRIIAWFFILFPAFFILAGWTLACLIIAAGYKLSRRRSYSFCFVVAALECMFVPLGTVLGVFTIIVLSRETVRELFDADYFHRRGIECG